jgi:hypothetical protein
LGDFREEILLLRKELQRFLIKARDGSFEKRIVVDGAEKYVRIDDIERVDVMKGLVNMIKKVSVDHVKLERDEMVSQEDVVMLVGGIVDVVRRVLSDDKKFGEDFIPALGRLCGMVETVGGKRVIDPPDTGHRGSVLSV